MYLMLISSLVCVHIEAARVSESFDGLQEMYMFVSLNWIAPRLVATIREHKFKQG